MTPIYTTSANGFTLSVFPVENDPRTNEYRLTEDSTGAIIDSAGMCASDLDDDKGWLSAVLTPPGFDPRKLEFSCNGCDQDEFDQVLRDTGRFYFFP